MGTHPRKSPVTNVGENALAVEAARITASATVQAARIGARGVLGAALLSGVVVFSVAYLGAKSPQISRAQPGDGAGAWSTTLPTYDTGTTHRGSGGVTVGRYPGGWDTGSAGSGKNPAANERSRGAARGGTSGGKPGPSGAAGYGTDYGSAYDYNYGAYTSGPS